LSLHDALPIYSPSGHPGYAVSPYSGRSWHRLLAGSADPILGTHESERQCRRAEVADHYTGLSSHPSFSHSPSRNEFGYDLFALGSDVWYLCGPSFGAGFFPAGSWGTSSRKKAASDVSWDLSP